MSRAKLPGGTSNCLRKPPKVKNKTAAFDEVPRLAAKYRGCRRSTTAIAEVPASFVTRPLRVAESQTCARQSRSYFLQSRQESPEKLAQSGGSAIASSPVCDGHSSRGLRRISLRDRIQTGSLSSDRRVFGRVTGFQIQEPAARRGERHRGHDVGGLRPRAPEGIRAVLAVLPGIDSGIASAASRRH